MIDRSLFDQAANLSPAERLELIGALWDTLSHADIPVTEDERALVDARLTDAARHPGDESPLSRVRARLGE
ncbi:hypothetical protein PC39_16161 [Salinisphaera sp. PC39]|uniref:addiction module protein n=1 Tax=Salinisphaera sp. PC39 TaxID=1304156 RepID=UPI003342D41D